MTQLSSLLLLIVATSILLQLTTKLAAADVGYGEMSCGTCNWSHRGKKCVFWNDLRTVATAVKCSYRIFEFGYEWTNHRTFPISACYQCSFSKDGELCAEKDELDLIGWKCNAGLIWSRWSIQWRVTLGIDKCPALQPAISTLERETWTKECPRHYYLHITSAYYGTPYGCRFSDVTSKLRQICSGPMGQKCSLRVTNDALGGDPARGTRKMLTVNSYCEAGEFYRRTPILNEGQTWNMECPDGRIVIDDAVYGVSHGFYWVTSEMMELCSGKTRCSVRASNGNFGDPLRGVEKFFNCRYHCICSIPEPRQGRSLSSSMCNFCSLQFGTSWGNANNIIQFSREQTAAVVVNRRLSCPSPVFLRKHTVAHRNIAQHANQEGWNQNLGRYDRIKTIFYSDPRVRVSYIETSSFDECYNTVGYQEAYVCTYNGRQPYLYTCELYGNTCLAVHSKLTGHFLHRTLYCGALTSVGRRQNHVQLNLR